MAAKLLPQDRNLARGAASALARHLATTRPGNRTSFEEHLVTQEDLWKSLLEFSEAEPAVLLWHGNGRFERLFKFLAPRFLLAPDHVLDAERIHARWQWSCRTKRALKIQTMNASLRLTHHLEHNQTFPSHEELLQHLHAEAMDHKFSMEALDDDVPLGWKYRAASALTQNHGHLLMTPSWPSPHDPTMTISS